MDSWIDVQGEIIEAGKAKGIPGDTDKVRRDSYKKLAALTGRPLIGAPSMGADLRVEVSCRGDCTNC
jgi:hypothetical protein